MHFCGYAPSAFQQTLTGGRSQVNRTLRILTAFSKADWLAAVCCSIQFDAATIRRPSACVAFSTSSDH
jgi:hypothetical protein